MVYRRDYEDTTKSNLLVQPLRRAVTVRIYDKDDLMVAQLSSNSQTCGLLDLNWKLLETGCGEFELETTTRLPVAHDYRVDVHLWNNYKPAYSGLIQNLPEPGGTATTFQYKGYGFFDLINRMVVTAKYPAQELRGIAVDLANKAAARYKRFDIDYTLVAGSSYSMTGQLDFLNTPLKDALKQVSDLSGDYVWGINADRKFFFQPRATSVDMHLWVGKHLKTWLPRSDSTNILNTLYIKCGAVRKDVAVDNPLYKTNWLDAPATDPVSIGLYGPRDGIFTAPSVLGLIDAQQAGQVELSRRSKPRQYATVSGLIYNGEELSCSGSARVVGKDGEELILPKKSLKFALKGTYVDVSLELGDLAYGAELLIARLAATAAAGELARQQSQKQL
jgi:hypothetical protein